MKEKYIIDDKNYCGKCPECNHDWDGGLNRDNKPTSNLVKIENSDTDQWLYGQSIHYQCPNCNIAWDSVTGERTEKFKVMLVDNSKMENFIANLIKGTKK